MAKKIEIIKELENKPGVKKKNVAEKFKITPLTLSTIWKTREDIKRTFFGGNTSGRVSCHEGESGRTVACMVPREKVMYALFENRIRH